jgi:hypothetical protein
MPEEVLFGPGRLDTAEHRTNHITYLGAPLLAVCLLLSLRRRQEGRLLGWSLVVVGVVLALGPRLVSEGAFVRVAGQRVLLPALLLERLHYPIEQSGMWYRAIHLASLGLALTLAGACARLPRGVGATVAWLVAIGAWYDAKRVTDGFWPRGTEPVSGRAAYEQWAVDGGGVVIDLPLEHDTFGGQGALLAAAVHGRGTTAVPRVSLTNQRPELDLLQRRVRHALGQHDPAVARELLSARGFGYVALRTDMPGAVSWVGVLDAGLGPAQVDDDLYWWRLTDPP